MKKKRGKNKFNYNLVIVIIVVCLVLILAVAFLGNYFKKSSGVPGGKGELPSGGIFPQGGGNCIDYENGTLSYNGTTYTNTCTSNKVTYYCDYDGVLSSTGKNCTYGCLNNYCAIVPKCIPSWRVINYSSQGLIESFENNTPESRVKLYDYCNNSDYLIKYYCIGWTYDIPWSNIGYSYENHLCNYGCVNNTCPVVPQCIQSWNVKNYNKYGMLETYPNNEPSSNIKIYNYCEDSNNLIFYSCSGWTYAKPWGNNGTSSEKYLCQYGCDSNIETSNVNQTAGFCLPSPKVCASTSETIKNKIVELKNSGNMVHLIEGWGVRTGEYVVLSQNSKSRILKLDDAYTRYANFTDVISGEKINFYQTSSGSSTPINLTIDGEVYKIWIDGDSDGTGSVFFNWGSGSMATYDNFSDMMPTKVGSGDEITQTCYCGDGTCSNGETCSSCSQDCGVCSSGGGNTGGGSVNNPKTYSLKTEEITTGSTQQLNKNDKIVFSIPAETSSGSHSLVVNQVTTNSATITIMSNPISLILNVGESKKLNLTSPDYYNLYVKLESITNNKASVTIKTIHEDIPKNNVDVTNPPLNTPKENPVVNQVENTPRTNSFNWFYIIIPILLMLIIIVAILLFFKFKSK